ncbi:hypothetical protein PR202_ga12957 [Eleusine coracana subsp. coracana]|uniref:Uncharacterized protein n=1 Tax=Eleusine coracana subsp. coracana TaxID=191504 RepID=A0AAV5CDM1_ELECO|nr:hypothetical protein PR202_ga12957 [Eleusine coracana subsp. coracana]
MDDSSLFMQWALSTLQHEHPPAPAPNDGFSTLPELENSESLNSIVPAEPPAREGNRATGSWSSGDTDIGSGWSPSENSATNTNQPMDKATILSDATRYLKELQEKLKAHEDDHRKIQSSVPTKKPRITVPDDKDGGSPSYVAAVPTGTSGALPEIEARISEGNVMVRIHCEDVKGSLVRLFAEVEELHLSIVHANAMPFSASTLIIHIMAEASSLTSLF